MKKYSHDLTRSIITVAVLSAVALPSLGGGLYIGEFGHPNQGASGAGAQALIEDASTAWQNPAGISFLGEKKTMATGIIINTEIEFQQKMPVSLQPPAVADAAGGRPASDGGDAGSTAIGAAFFHARPINDKWGWGISLASISAAIMEYDDPEDFAGRYWTTEVTLLTVTLMPALSYRVSEDFSVGLGLPILYGGLEMDVVIPGAVAGAAEGLAEIEDGDDTTVGVTVSAMWQASDTLRLGLLYLSKTDLDFDADLSLNLPPGELPDSINTSVEFTFPQTLRFSATQELNESMTLLVSAAWEDWSDFDEIAIGTSMGSGALERNWDDTWRLALGLRWQPDARWTWRGGIAYDSDPTKPEDRTADMPIDEQWRYSFGTTYERENGHKIGLVLTYADYGSAKIDNGGPRPISGAPWTVTSDYSSNRILFLGFNYGW